jgi:hypothetical protein
MSLIKLLSKTEPAFTDAQSVIVHKIPMLTEWTPEVLELIKALPPRYQEILVVKFNDPDENLSVKNLGLRLGIPKPHMYRYLAIMSVHFLHHGFNLGLLKINFLIDNDHPAEVIDGVQIYSLAQLTEIIGESANAFRRLTRTEYVVCCLRFGLNNGQHRLPVYWITRALDRKQPFVTEYVCRAQAKLAINGILLRQSEVPIPGSIFAH